MTRLARAVSDLARRPAGDRPQLACAALGEVLELDAAWLLGEPGARDPVVASWTRAGAAPAKFGDHRLRALTGAAGDLATSARDGRYAVVTAPVVHGSERIALLVGAARSPRDPTDEDVACAALVAAAVADAVPHEPPADGGRPIDQMLMLQSLAGALARAQSEAEVAWAVVNELRTLIDYHACRFYLLSRAGDLLVPVAHRGLEVYESDRTEDLECAVGEGIAGHAMVAPVPRLIPNARVDEFAVDIPGTDDVDESMLVAPMLIDGDPIGVVVLSHRGANRFEPDDLRLLEVVASHAAFACHNVRLLERTREQAEVSEALLDLSVALSAQQSVEDVARMVAVAADRLVESATLSVWLRDGERLRLAAQQGYTPGEARRLRLRGLDASDPVLAAALDRRRVTVFGAEDAPEPLRRVREAPHGSTVAIVAIGERAGNVGAIVVQRGPRRGAPTPRDEQVLNGIADQSLLALTNRTLYDELEQSFLATVQALGTALDTKDEYTAEHAQALVGLTANVAVRVGMTGNALRDVTFAAALHDIGKIGIPAEILRKPGPLTEDEWEVMRRHPELGARIIEPVPALTGARELVLACHEHWDGSGYPSGLRGEQVPLGARVILACDAFHAMTSDRVYRPAMTLPDAIAELRRCKASYFDPVVTDALISAVTEPGEHELQHQPQP